MRFGSRNNHNDDAERAERVEVRQEMRAPRPAPARAPLPPVTSARLRRIAEYFVAQEELQHEMQRQVEMETAPLAELLVRQQTTMQQTMANLEDRLRPLNEYADAEEANLGALEQRISGAGMDLVARSFAEYLATQRERIAETRAHIDEQRGPFLRYDEDARGVVEVALSRFDDDLGALEQNLSEQRRVMLRMLDAMRSEAFASAKELLLSREALMEEMARTGVTDPSEISSRLHSLRSDVNADGGNAHVLQVIAATDTADQRLSATSTGRPRAVANRNPVPEIEAASTSDAGEATTA